MIDHQPDLNQLPKELKSAFQELKITKFLQQALISPTTIVFSRYILLAWQHRKSTDGRSFGGLFYLLCDEVGTLDWTIALQQLFDLMNEIATKVGKRSRL